MLPVSAMSLLVVALVVPGASWALTPGVDADHRKFRAFAAGVSAAPLWSSQPPAFSLGLAGLSSAAERIGTRGDGAAPPAASPPLAANGIVPLSWGEAECPAFPRRLLVDVPALVVAPAGWEALDWKKLGLGALAVAAVSLVDEPIAHWIEAHPNSRAIDAAHAVRPLGQEAGLALVAGAWAIGQFGDRPKLEAFGADALESTILAAGVITPLLKVVVGRKRPRQADDPRWAGTQGRSFPSGEATEAFAIASVAAAHADRTWVKATAWGLAGLIGLQRMRLDAHYASDVLAGALIGSAVGRWVVRRNRPEVEPGSTVSAVPIIGVGTYGASVRVTF